MHNTQQSSHTNSTVYRPCKNNNLSTDSVDSIFLPSSSVRPAREMNVRMMCSLLVCTVKCMGWGIPMHAHRARGVPTGCWTHPRGDPVLLAPSPRLNRELYPHTHGFPVGPAGNPLSPSPCSSLHHRLQQAQCSTCNHTMVRTCQHVAKVFAYAVSSLCPVYFS